MKALIQSLLGNVAATLFKPAGLSVFCFHDVALRPSAFAERHGLCLHPDLFRRHLAWIADHFTVVHPDSVAAGATLPPRAALITFDDGWKGSFTNALPILTQLGMPSLHFLNGGLWHGETLVSALAEMLDSEPGAHLTLTPDAAGQAGDVAALQSYAGDFVDAEDLARWDGHALVRYGSHLWNHWNAAAQDDATLIDQYQRNEQALAGYKSHTRHFAWPNGQPHSCFSPAQVSVLAGLGARPLYAAAGGGNDAPAAVLLDRVALTPWHDRPARLWFALHRLRLAALAGRPGPLAGAEWTALR